MGVLSFAALCLALVPMFREDGLRIPISFQLANRDKTAWAMLFILILVMLVLAWRMAKWDRWASAVTLCLDIAGLVYISLSDPRSLNHLFAFIATAFVTSIWLFLLANDLDDLLLKWMAYGAIGGIALSFAVMGYGERVLLVSSLAGANLLYYGYFLDGQAKGTL